MICWCRNRVLFQILQEQQCVHENGPEARTRHLYWENGSFSEVVEGNASWKQSHRRVHPRARETFDVVLAHRLHLSWSGSNAAEL